ncbi:hypothetical protein U1Q18_016718, partial [Sarracenia purpurea var. burkii]
MTPHVAPAPEEGCTDSVVNRHRGAMMLVRRDDGGTDGGLELQWCRNGGDEGWIEVIGIVAGGWWLRQRSWCRDGLGFETHPLSSLSRLSPPSSFSPEMRQWWAAVARWWSAPVLPLLFFPSFLPPLLFFPPSSSSLFLFCLYYLRTALRSLTLAVWAICPACLATVLLFFFFSSFFHLFKK